MIYFLIATDIVSIMERPNVAIEIEPNWLLHLSLAALVGAVIGFLLRWLFKVLSRKVPSA